VFSVLIAVERPRLPATTNAVVIRNVGILYMSFGRQIYYNGLMTYSFTASFIFNPFILNPLISFSNFTI
jgi:hypothetical protein